MSGTIRLTAPQGVTHVDRARRITAFALRSGTGLYTSLFSEQAPNMAGSHRISTQIAIPSDATEFFMRLTNGTSTADPSTVWWDKVGLYERNEYGDPPASYWSPGTL